MHRSCVDRQSGACSRKKPVGNKDSNAQAKETKSRSRVLSTQLSSRSRCSARSLKFELPNTVKYGNMDGDSPLGFLASSRSGPAVLDRARSSTDWVSALPLSCTVRPELSFALQVL
ncbi:hypothetical protein TGPRC2_246535 [Toxoplasma gondii TgCatPRC2]|uniref:Uncharacterized protein n=1 Tax=Toxoplasma gondii TgCatPRC2 TaxID=1130821 RepID=A0A151HGC2_TOXGO|nr:hypothetical protein TGPRC2_246535 [Toxoplasma gondii TgCatPRC2]